MGIPGDRITLCENRSDDYERVLRQLTSAEPTQSMTATTTSGLKKIAVLPVGLPNILDKGGIVYILFYFFIS